MRVNPDTQSGLLAALDRVNESQQKVLNQLSSGLRIQIDAAINAGNSGGPAIAGDKMIGLAFSRLGDAQNIGFAIQVNKLRTPDDGPAGMGRLRRYLRHA